MQAFIQRVQHLPKLASDKVNKWMEGDGRRRRWLAESMTPDAVIFRNVTGTTYILMAVTGLGYLALMWSTVVLLGGFVTVLQKKDFWSVTIITMVQAVRIFNDLAEHLVSNFISMLAGNILVLAALLRAGAPAAMSTWRGVLGVLYMGAIVLPFQGISWIVACLYGYSGPVICIALALWRIAQRDYGADGSSGKSNLMPALSIFYSLVLFQGGVYVLWALWPLLDRSSASRLREYCRRLGQPDRGWCHDSLARYLSDARARCWRDPASIRGRTLHDFAVDLLDSGSWEDMLSGVRLLDAFIMRGQDVRSYLLPSRLRIQKLIQALGLGSMEGASEMRDPAARVVAHLAGSIHLSLFPGAMECIASLLLEETTLLASKQDDGGSRGGPKPNELILQGLAILEGLAFGHHNCRVICSTPGLLHKIMAPLSSADLIDGISNTDWANVVTRSFMVLCKLIQVPGTGKTSRRLRQEINSNKQSISNLEAILFHGDETFVLNKLQMGALEILTELALDLSIDLAKETKEKLVKRLLQIFLPDGEEGGEPVAVLKPPKQRAGKTLVLLSTKIESYSALIMTIQNDIIGRLTGILDPKNTTTYRTIAAQILENLCAQCDLDKQWVKEILLPKVLAEILSSKRGTPKNGVPPPNDEESQQNSEQDDMEIQETSSTADQNNSSDGRNKEQTTTAKLMREAFLALALVIRDKLISADDFDDAVQKIGLGPGAFVAKMKIIIEENCQETAESLRIIKLCGRIVEPMMQRDQYAQHFRNKQFGVSLSKASKIMSNLESCMLFAGTDFGSKKTTRPLLSDLKKRALHLVD